MAQTTKKKLSNGLTRLSTTIKRRRRANKAVRFLRNQSRKRTKYCPHGIPWSGHCAHTAACAYGKASSGWDAYQGWEQTLAKYQRDGRNMHNPPRGALVFWRGGQYGHVATSNGRGAVWGNDAPNHGVVGLADLDWFSRNWGNLTLVGWCWPDEAGGW